MKRNMMVLLAVVTLGVAAVYQNIQSKSEDMETVLPTETGPKAGSLAPAFSLDGLDGQQIQVGGKRDKPLFLNFWASWCGPCEEEAPDLARIYEKYKGQFDLYAVNVTGNDSVNDAKAFADRFKYTFPVLLDKKLSAAELYQVQFIPTSYLIDKNGVVVEVIHLLKPKELEKKIKQLIK